MSRKPLGYAIMGGVLFSTILTLFLVPVAYVVLDRLRPGRASPRQGRRDGAGGRAMILALLAALQVSTADSLPRVTLAEALAQGVRLSPDYVQSVGSISTAEWSRRAATLAFVIPSITAATDYSVFTTPQFNIGTGQNAKNTASARLAGSLELFTGGRRMAELGRARAELEGAQASEVQARYAAALIIEGTYYAVLGSRELLEVATATGPARHGAAGGGTGPGGERRRGPVRFAPAGAGVEPGPGGRSSAPNPRCAPPGWSWGGASGAAAPWMPSRSTRPTRPISRSRSRGGGRRAGAGSGIPGRPRQRRPRPTAILRERKAAYLPTIMVGGSYAALRRELVPERDPPRARGILSLSFRSGTTHSAS